MLKVWIVGLLLILLSAAPLGTGASAGDPQEEFVPSVKIPSGSAVSFPVDI